MGPRDSLNGGPHHRAICTECGVSIEGCNNDLCEDCYLESFTKCPRCGDRVQRKDITSVDICQACFDEDVAMCNAIQTHMIEPVSEEDAEIFVNKFLSNIT